MEITVNLNLFYLISSICAFLSLTLSIISAIFAFKAYSNVIGLQNSTHNVTYMPIDPVVDRENEEYLSKEQQGPEWATSDTTLAAQHKVYNEDLEEAGLDPFLPDEEGTKVHSF